MDMTPACLIFTPIFLPVCQEIGMHPVHFGIMMIFNLCIGTITPPVGTTLFVGVKVGHTRIEDVLGPILWYFAAIFGVLLLVTYIPVLSWDCRLCWGMCKGFDPRKRGCEKSHRFLRTPDASCPIMPGRKMPP